MGVNDRNRLADGYLSFEGGIDSGRPPSLISKNRVAWAVNTTFRDGWPECRPGWVKRPLDFAGDAAVQTGFEDGYFQGAGTYHSDDGRSFLACSVSGRVFTIEITNSFRVGDITIPGDPNQANSRHAWFEQAESWLVVQNSENPAFLYNGAGSRRAKDLEVPVGGPMAYGRGRLWVARGAQYFGGDLVYSDPTLGRDTVIRFTENTVIAEGGAFAVGDANINGLQFAANLDSSLGDGDLVVGTLGNVYAFNAPIDRTVWQNMEQPLQRYAARAFGPVNHESMVLVNGDIIYRSPDGIRSLQYSRRDFSQWGQTPISRQVHRALKFDTEQWLSEASGVNFDNRMLMTIQPQLENDHGVWHRGLVAIDYSRVNGIDEKFPPAWEGVWTGLRILRIITMEVENVLRCFIFALSDSNKITLWEVTKDAAFDRDDVDDIPIQWTIESRSMTFEKPALWKRLMGGVQWFDKILGTVSMQARYRADEAECWRPWDRWEDCAKYRECEATEACVEFYAYGNSMPIHPFRSQFRPYIGLTQPQDVPEGQTGGFTRDGYEFQIRYECSGRFRIKRLAIIADELSMPLWGDSRKVTCAPADSGDCQTLSCHAVACCDLNDFAYSSSPNPEPPPYPAYPPDGGGEEYPGDGEVPGGGEEGGGDGEVVVEPDTNPVYDSEDPGGNVDSTPCSAGTIVYLDSIYVWGLGSELNPNTELSQEQIDCHIALHDIEMQALIAYYEGLGYTVSLASGKKWVWYGFYGQQYSMLRKSTCDPNDGIDDILVVFNGYQTIQQAICVITPT